MMSKRTRTILLIVMSVMVVGVYGLLMVLILRQQSGPEIPSRLVTAAPEEPLGTALEEYPRAEAAARAWRDDVWLVGLNAAWSQPTEADLIAGPFAWSFQFFSPSANQIYDVVITNAGVEGVPGQALETAPTSIEMAEWRVDSSEAVLHFLAHEGRTFLAENHVTTVRLRLSAALSPGRVVWMAAALSSTERTGLSILVDAFSGDVEAAQPAPGP
jgi:hypothetical protein